jgi:energy-coupling factor transport system substrate-specific component
MINMNGELSRTKRITYTGMLIGLAVAMRLAKQALFGSMQFINFPGVFTILSGVMFGPTTGMVVGFSSYLLSDMIIGLPGPWTAINAILMASLGLASGLIWGRKTNVNVSKTGLAIGSYMLMFAFDIFASCLWYIMIGWNWIYAFTLGLVGLFLPAGGGYLIGIGPITEATTTLLIVAIVQALRNSRVGFNKKSFIAAKS